MTVAMTESVCETDNFNVLRSSKKCLLKPQEVFLAVSEEPGLRVLVWQLGYPLSCALVWVFWTTGCP